MKKSKPIDSIPHRKILAEQFLQKALAREVKGLITYGDFSPKTDKRILSVEAQEECIDILNYLRFYEKKYGKSLEVTTIKQMAFKIYAELRRLELVETSKRGGDL